VKRGGATANSSRWNIWARFRVFQGSRGSHIIMLTRIWSVLAFFLPMFGGFVGIGVVLELERGTLLIGGIAGAIVGWGVGQFVDRKLYKNAIARDRQERQETLNDSEQNRLKQIKQARWSGSFKQWETPPKR